MKRIMVEGITYRTDKNLYRARIQKDGKKYTGYSPVYTECVEKLWKAQLEIWPEKALSSSALQYLLKKRPEMVLKTLGLQSK